MPNSLKYESFELIEEQLASATSWIESFGLSTANTRLRRYAAEIHELNNANKDKLEGQEHRFLEALFEANELITIHSLLVGKEVPGLEKRLKKLIGGAVDRCTEPTQGAGIKARNTGFELNVAGRFASIDLLPNLSTNTDVVLNLSGHTLFTECKRPSSESKVRVRINDGIKQCKNAISSHKSSRASGIVAIDCSRIINPESKSTQLNDISTIDKTMSGVMRSFQNEMLAKIDFTKHKKIIGTFMLFGMMIVNARDASVNHVQQWSFIKNPYVSKHREILGHHISESLQKAMRKGV